MKKTPETRVVFSSCEDHAESMGAVARRFTEISDIPSELHVGDVPVAVFRRGKSLGFAGSTETYRTAYQKMLERRKQAGNN